MLFTDELREATKDSWEQSLNHPFVQGIAKGTLPLENFKYYILQDIYYLKHYAKIHAIAASQADDFSITAKLADQARNTAEAELDVHQEHAKHLNITQRELDAFKPAPTAYGYTSHLYRATMEGSLAHTVAAMLPCYWLYADIGKQYADATPEIEIYQNWINMYTDDWFQNEAQTQIDLLNDLVKNMNNDEKQKIAEQFIIAKEYELSFWEMSYTKETWFSKRNANSLT